MSLRALILALVLAATATPGRAGDYPWCSNFADGAGVNCGFKSYEQCMATARRTGGYYTPNAMLKLSPGSRRPTQGARQWQPRRPE